MDLVVQFGLAGLRDMVRRLLARRQDIDWNPWRAETVEGLLAAWERSARDEALPRAAARIARSAARPPKCSASSRRDLPSHPLMRQRARRCGSN